MPRFEPRRSKYPPFDPGYNDKAVVVNGIVAEAVQTMPRGSTSLESFHLHPNRFIPGELIGVEYLYNQTDQVLDCDINDTNDLDGVAEDLDEGYKTVQMFSAWPDLVIRLDVWHFMRRIARACTTESHLLYKSFMGRLSQCIFQWDRDDLELLKAAKRRQMEGRHIPNPSDADVLRNITKDELALHCRRTTRGTDETIALIDHLLETYSGPAGHDTLGVPLLDQDRLTDIWRYSAKDAHYQAFLLEGVARWNHDRAAALGSNGPSDPRCYSGQLRFSVNQLADRVLGKIISPGYAKPRKYTGELIGVEYLYNQTDQVLDCDINNTDDLDGVAEDLDEGTCLTTIDVNTLVWLWDRLSDYDKKPTTFPSRFKKSTPEHGTFRKRKATQTAIPGAEITARCFAGGKGCASTPDCNRYTEALIRKLFAFNPSTGRKARVDYVCNDYARVKNVVMKNARVLAETNIQLPQLNRHTISTWFNKEGKEEERTVLEQGIRFQVYILIWVGDDFNGL
nr:hypothetical protein BaRGS_003198 [Batillaria attramentaria]